MSVLTDGTSGSEGDPAARRAHLRTLLDTPAVREAIAIASPDLDQDIEIWFEQPESARGQRIERSLVRYLSRMAGRPTPFGLFAAMSTARVADETELDVAPIEACQRRVTVDGELIVELAGLALADPQLRSRLRFRRNPTLRRAGDRLRYSQWIRLPGRAGSPAQRRYRMVELPLDLRVLAIADAARHDRALTELVDSMKGTWPELDRSAMTRLVERMVAAQILVARLGTVLTGAEPLDAFIDELVACEVEHPLLAAAQAARNRLAAANQGPAGGRLSELRSIAADVSKLVPAPVRTIHGELFRPAGQARVSRAVIESIGRGAQLLWRLAPDRSHARSALHSFRRAFVELYGSAEVPLLDALDSGCAAEFHSSSDLTPVPGLLAGLSPPPKSAPPVGFTRREAHLLRRIDHRRDELVLTEQDIEALSSRDRPMPQAFAVLATVLPEDQIIIDGGSGPSGARTLGRFCHGDRSVAALVDEHIAAEQAHRPDHLFAEIVHLPAEPVASVQSRPALRAAEIVLSGASSAHTERIEPDELTVSVRSGAVVLRCPRLGKVIVPRQSSAHGPRLGDPLYRFLLAVQDQDGGTFGWSWGCLSEAPSLPRVRRGPWIFARARWRLFGDEIAGLDAGLLTRLREQRGLPRHVALVSGDSELPVDLDNPLSVQSFVHLVRGRDHAVLCELLPAPDELRARGPGGGYHHQLVVPFTRAADRVQARSQPPARAPRIHRLGSSWLTLHVYGPADRADQVLTDLVAPLRRGALASGACDRWFFVRYQDSVGPHLRVRLHGSAPALTGEVLSRAAQMAAPLLAAGSVERLSIGEYRPEVSRYGGQGGLDAVERLMSCDSEAVLDLLALPEGRRWLAALAGIDRLWSDFGLEMAARMNKARECYAALTAEQGQAKEFAMLVRARYQQARKLIGQSMGQDSPVQQVLERRSQGLRPVVAELFALESKGALVRPACDMAVCLGHLHVNRLLPSAQRAQERVLYGILSRHHGERIGRARSHISQQPKEAA